MARFGLIESDSDSEASTSASPPPSTTKSKSTRSRSTTNNQFQSPSSSNSEEEEEEDGDEQQIDEDEDDEDEEEEDSAPPRASLMSEDDDEDEEMSEDLSSSRLKPTQRQRDKSIEEEEDDEDEGNSSFESGILSPRNGRNQRSNSTQPIKSQLNATPTSREPWPQTLKLESKRVAVMQASFFHQAVDKSLVEKHAEKEREVEKDRKRKEAAISAASGRRKDDITISADTGSRPNFAAPIIDPKPFRQFRKYSRVALSTSVTNGKEVNIIDSGLMLGRSTGVAFGPEGKIVHLGSLYGVPGSAKSDTITISRMKVLSQSSSFEAASALRTLEIQLNHTPIYVDNTTQIPFAVTHPELRFSNFTSTDRSPEAHLWRLGHALFDEIDDLSIPENVSGDYSRHVVDIRRRDRLEKWLEDVVKGDVEEDLRDISGSSTGAKRVFALLSGHQIERACEAAIEVGDLRLATLVAQAGGDDEFREDIYLQLAKWREYRVDSHISNAYRKVYEVLCGNVGLSEGVAKGDIVNAADEIHIAEGLDWKRTFGLHLWYGTYQLPLSTTVERYQKASEDDNRVAPPLPSYIERPNVKDSKTTMWKSSPRAPQDPLFELIKIFTDSTHSLESALLPRNFGTSPLDYRLPWHLYVLFSRVLRRRDFEDRSAVKEDGLERDGHSTRADMMTESYATQLELNGMWKWAVFVLLHLEIPDRRAKAIKEILARNVDEIEEGQMVFLVETLKIPVTWIYSAQAISAKYNGDVWAQYQLLLLAEEFAAAHEIAVLELAPEAVIRNDIILLRKLFEPFEPIQVAEWDAGGRIFVQYADCVEQLRLLQTSAASDQLLLDLIHTVPLLLERPQGGIKLKVAITEMQSKLTAISSAFEKHANAIRASTLQEADRGVWVKGLNSAFFAESMQSALV